MNSVDEAEAFSHGKHILKTSCVARGYFDCLEIKSILPKDVRKAKCTPKKGAIIVSRMNTPALVGELGYVPENKPNTFLPDRLWQMLFKNNADLNARWLAYLLSSSPVAQRIKESATGTSGSMKNISKGSLMALGIAQPPGTEQNAIVNALSDVDALLSELEKLIAKKQAIKTATMQQLLTGRTRLPQFSLREDGSSKGTKKSELGNIPEDWKVQGFGELFESSITRKSVKQSELVSFVGMQDVSENAQLTNQSEIQYRQVKSGFTYFEKRDVLVAKITPCFENGKGCHTEQLETDIGFGSTEFHVLRAKDSFDSVFIYFWTTRASLRVALEAEMVGSAGHRRVPFSALQNYQIPCSSDKNEQIAIANVLSDMDKEVQALEQRLNKTRQIKQGMMQELLTGKTRLVTPQVRG